MKIKILVLLIAGLFSFITATSAQETTTSLLESAQIKAKEEGKAVFIKFEASWCGWCHKMTKDMKAEGIKKFFEENYVIVPIVVNETKENEKLENPGSKDLLKKYEGDKAGLPFWVILDSDLKVITNSFDAKGQNLGGPASNEEVNEFIKKIKKSAKIVSEKDVKNIKKQFIQ
ncbi:thioredoxin family protein [Polaribacter sp. ALD11]|uniref:thioredoxin family protein n=1 Tax=Polaribacter sp. ALD11 TaxID=2058137 RepID=UPI000C3132A9|nr:thioredoxin family protein [Polaribacter sp. ALD11]AUC84113.1 thioredoxin family protein [Polaribacter sp. ALD11]